MVYSTLFSLATIAQLAIGYTVTRYLAEFRSLDKAKAGRIMGLCSAVSGTIAAISFLVLLGGASLLADAALKAPNLSVSFMVGSGYLFFSVVNGYQIGALAGLESYYGLARAGVVSSSLNVLSCVAGSYIWGLEGAVGGLTVGSLLGFLVHHYLLKVETERHEIKVGYRDIFQELSLLTKFSLPATLSGIVIMIGTWLGNAILVRQPGGYSEFALYSAAMGLRAIAMLFPRISFVVVNSFLSNQLGKRDRHSYQRTFWVNIILSGVTVLAVGACILVVGKTLLGLYGSNFVEAYSILIILMVAAPLEALALAVYQLIQTLEKMWVSFFGIRVPSYLAFLALAYWLSPKLGAKGLALAFTIGLAINLSTTSVLAWKYRTDLHEKTMDPLM